MRYSAICILLVCCLIQATAQKQPKREPPIRNPGSERASSTTLLFGWEGSDAYLVSDLAGFQSGVEISFGKKRLYRLNAYVVPFAQKHRIPNYRREGLRGELGLGFKKFFYGRLTGHLSKVYIGTQLRSGRHVYTYKGIFNTYMRMERGCEWYMFLGDIGIQLPGDWITFDISLSTGIEAATYYHNWTGNGPVMRLGISCGFRI